MNRLKVNYYWRNVFNIVSSFLLYNIKKLILIAIIAVLGIILGIRYGLFVDFENAITKYCGDLIKFIKGDKSALTYYFTNLFFTIIICGVFFIISCNFITAYISLFIVFYRGFMLGITVTLLFLNYGIASLLLIILCIIPLWLIFLILSIIMAAIAINYSHECHCFGFSKREFNGLIIKLVTIAIIFFLLLIVECILTYFLAIIIF